MLLHVSGIRFAWFRVFHPLHPFVIPYTHCPFLTDSRNGTGVPGVCQVDVIDMFDVIAVIDVFDVLDGRGAGQLPLIS
ncbi:hypothetical protein [Streptomyces sp. S.PB5]|uniref:hypothetical protein n=1 Tax=Streptomyces sp. S.PB5 TaxID=3020844 RepID=UPI0025AFAB53|nr:hypothetical protein [Streptomyces sp. S.PB5]MDN3022569.1 hypothetical protein [Streptomyces sp. S.PB5]